MALAFLATLAVQISSAFFNSVRGKRLSEELAEKQRAYEEKATREGIENAKAEFAELCEFQRSIEAEMQRDRLELIKSNHQKTLMLEAYGSSLENWPLLVPPYVLKNDSIFSLGPTEKQPIPLNCILTTSTDGKFNSSVFYKLEENLAEFCSKYWNIATAKSIRFLQNTWRDNVTDIASKHKNLYAHLKDIPTLVLSPIIRGNKLIFRFYWWGLSLNPAEAHIDELNELDPELNIAVSRNMQYDDATIQTILSECTPKLEAFISFFADMYYWNFYHLIPTLPSLIHSSNIELLDTDTNVYSHQYSDLLRKFLNGTKVVNNLSNIWLAISPIINNNGWFINETLQYIQRIPDQYKIEYDKILDVLALQNITSCQKEEIDSLKSDITLLQKRQKSDSIAFKIHKAVVFSLKDIVEIMLEVKKTLPHHDSFNIIVNKEKLYAIAFFTLGDEIITWDNNGIDIFLSKSMVTPNNLFTEKFSTFSCPSSQATDLLILLNYIMTKKEITEILDAHYSQLKQKLIPLSNQLEDVFSQFISQVKKDLAKEFKSREVEQFNRKELKYEDIVKWLREAKEVIGGQPFDGAFLTKQKSGFFDKYPFKLYICLTHNKQPLAESNHPKGVFCYEKTDDSIDDMFGSNNSVQLNFK